MVSILQLTMMVSYLMPWFSWPQVLTYKQYLWQELSHETIYLRGRLWHVDQLEGVGRL